MLANRWVVLGAALIFWAAFFYLMNWLVMQGQGLPVGLDLMPV